MVSSVSKATLALCIYTYIISQGTVVFNDNQRILLAGGLADVRVAKKISTTCCTDIPNLFNSEEKADGRIIIHVWNNDTYVLVLLLHYVTTDILGASVYMHGGHSTKHMNIEQYIPINK